jgi:hypothetical protein
MSCPIKSDRFDIGATAVAVGLTIAGINSSLVRGLQCFSLANIADRAARRAIPSEVVKREPTLQNVLVNPLIEEAIYSGILLPQGPVWMIPRIGVALFTGMTAARALFGRVEPQQNAPGLTLDTKIGLAWSLAREVLCSALPSVYSIPLLVSADSIVFGLSEVCPSKEDPGPPQFSRVWYCKALSGAFFRATANTAALSFGIAASITQHLIFNFSRVLPE